MLQKASLMSILNRLSTHTKARAKKSQIVARRSGPPASRLLFAELRGSWCCPFDHVHRSFMYVFFTFPKGIWLGLTASSSNHIVYCSSRELHHLNGTLSSLHESVLSATHNRLMFDSKSLCILTIEPPFRFEKTCCFRRSLFQFAPPSSSELCTAQVQHSGPYS